MRLHGGSTHEEDEFHRDIVVGVLKQTADVARERVVDTVATAAAVAETREILQFVLIAKGEGGGPLLTGQNITEVGEGGLWIHAPVSMPRDIATDRCLSRIS